MRDFYSMRKPLRTDTISITYESKMFPGAIDPFDPLVTEYANEYGLEIKTVDKFYQYKFVDDEFDVRFIWNGNFTIYVYVPVRRHYAEIESRLKRLINKLNRNIRENKIIDYKPNSMI